MANYTIELKDIVACGHNIFNFPYQFYDEKKRKEFEDKFIRHFYFREIGCDSIDRFRIYLRDKMDTVFPYYNELFKAAQIEYSVLDNYNMTESTTTTRENTAKSNGSSYSVGQIFESQEDTTTESRNVNTEGTTSESVSDTSDTTRNGTSEKTRNGTSEKSRNGTSENTLKETTTDNSTTTTDETVTTSQDDKKRFMDTPMGRVDLSDNKFLTTMNHDTLDGEKNTDGTVTVADTSEKDMESNATTTETENITTTDTENATDTETVKVTDKRTANGDTTNTEEFEATATGIMKGEQRNTADNNTRLESVGNEIEKIEHHRRGNIGIDTDSELIQKHLQLQKIVRKIELMFFDECEDLFMLVY